MLIAQISLGVDGDAVLGLLGTVKEALTGAKHLRYLLLRDALQE